MNQVNFILFVSFSVTFLVAACRPATRKSLKMLVALSSDFDLKLAVVLSSDFAA